MKRSAPFAPSRRLAAAACLALCLPLGSASADNSFPNRPIRLVAGIAAGGTVDIMARLYAKELSALLNTPVVVDNRPGAFQTVAIRTVVSAAPDGYTLFFTNGSAISWSPAANKELPYDPFRDFTFIAETATTSSVMLTRPDMPFKTLPEMIAYSKANKGKLSYGSAGMGTASHLKIEYLKAATGLDATHIPYKSDAEVILALQGKELHLGIATMPASKPAVDSGALHAMVVTSPDENPLLPGVPGTRKAGLPVLDGLEPYSFYGFVGPAKMPKEVVDKLNAAVNKVSQMPEIRSRMIQTLGMDMVVGSPEDFRQRGHAEYRKAVQYVKTIKP